MQLHAKSFFLSGIYIAIALVCAAPASWAEHQTMGFHVSQHGIADTESIPSVDGLMPDQVQGPDFVPPLSGTRPQLELAGELTGSFPSGLDLKTFVLSDRTRRMDIESISRLGSDK